MDDIPIRLTHEHAAAVAALEACTEADFNVACMAMSLDATSPVIGRVLTVGEYGYPTDSHSVELPQFAANDDDE
jgi:hypothetical protein